MDLLKDRWIPASDERSRGRLSLGDVLCTERGYEANSPRDDFDAASVTLAASIVQTLFPDLGDEELVARERVPLEAHELERRAAAHAETFQLFHLTHPFMQTRGIDRPPKVAGQLVPGSPGETSHLHGNRATAAPRRLCAPCATLALYTRATMTPSFGGGYCNSLRGGAPIDFHVRGPNLRRTIWRNVVAASTRRTLIPEHARLNDLPTWVSPIPEATAVSADTIGLVRGLLWQPASIELLPDSEPGRCDLCGDDGVATVSRFRASKFKVVVSGSFPHPRGARISFVDKKTDERRTFFASYTDTSPAWTSLRGWRAKGEVGPRDWPEPPIVAQFRRLWPDQRVEVVAVGCAAEKAKIEFRRIDTISLDDPERSLAVAETATRIRDALSSAVYRLATGLGIAKAEARARAARAEARYCTAVDPAVAAALAAGASVDADVEAEFRRSAQRAFDEAVENLGGGARALRETALGRVGLRAALARGSDREGGIR